MAKELRLPALLLLPAWWAASPELTCAQALEQSSSAPQALTDQDRLQEIVVTASKRASTVQDTSISVTALSGADLQERGITDVTSIVQSVPGAAMRTSGPGQTELEMRGMTSSGGNSSTVGFYLGDTPLTAPAAAQNGKVVIDPDLYDLNRVEVLRGPQGTLYGSGSMGGTVKLIPNSPDPRAFDTSGEVILGHTNRGDTLNHSERAMVNLPITDTLALRLVGSLESLSGWIDRIVISQPNFPAPLDAATRGNVAAAPVQQNYHDINNVNKRSVRAAMLWNATDRLSIEPSFLYQRITQGGLSLIDSQPGTYANYQPFDIAEPFEDRITIGSVTARYHFDAFDVSSTSSYWNRDEPLRVDGTEQLATALGLPIYASRGGAGAFSPVTLEDDRSRQYSEEIRLTSAGDSAFKWLLGYFYQDFVSDWNLYVTSPQTAVPGTIANAVTQIQPSKILQNSVFGEASYTLWNRFTATFGLRRYYYHASVNTAASGWLTASGDDSFAYYSTGERDSGITPKIDLSYQPERNLRLYTTAAQGFRPGGGNQPIPTSGALGAQCLTNLRALGLSSAPLGFEPDRVWSYELGEKFRDSDGRLTVNSAAYFENWQHIQQNIPLACGFPFTGNAGAAHIYGAELEINAVLATGLVASVNGSWLHAAYVANSVPDTTIDNRVQDVPQVTASASLNYRHPISGGLAVFARIDNSYVGSRIDTTAQANYLPAYDLTNLRAGIGTDSWSAALFATNVTNRLALLTNSPAVNVNVATFNRVAIEQPLTVGIDFNYHLGGTGSNQR